MLWRLLETDLRCLKLHRDAFWMLKRWLQMTCDGSGWRGMLWRCFGDDLGCCGVLEFGGGRLLTQKNVFSFFFSFSVSIFYLLYLSTFMVFWEERWASLSSRRISSRSSTKHRTRRRRRRRRRWKRRRGRKWITTAAFYSLLQPFQGIRIQINHNSKNSNQI